MADPQNGRRNKLKKAPILSFQEGPAREPSDKRRHSEAPRYERKRWSMSGMIHNREDENQKSSGMRRRHSDFPKPSRLVERPKLYVAGPLELGARDLSSWLKKVLKLFNKFRQRYGVPPLRLSSRLSKISKWSARDEVEEASNAREPRSELSFEVEERKEALRRRVDREGSPFRRIWRHRYQGSAGPEEFYEYHVATRGRRDQMINADWDQLGLHVCMNSRATRFWALTYGRSKSFHRHEILNTFTVGVNPAGHADLKPAILERWLREIHDLINETRQSHGLSTVRVSDALTLMAKLHTRDQAQTGVMSHEGSDGSRLRDRARRVGYKEGRMLENVAFGLKSPKAIHEGLMGSPGHAANILRPDAIEVGMHACMDYRSAVFYTEVYALARRG